MPIYEYACPDCGHDFEVIQKFSDDPVRDCPKCSLGNVRKKISATSFVLKGGGWYKDHYGLKSGSSSDASTSAASSAPATPAAPAAPASGGSSGGSSGGGTPPATS